MGLIIKPFAMLATGNLRGLFSFLLVLALFGALWETSLVNLSSRATATAVMTEVGIELVNPALQRGSFGLSQTGWAVLQAEAIANPAAPVTIPGLKVRILGSQIAHKSFDDGTRVIYQTVAQAYYDGGAGAVFSGPTTQILPSGLLPSLPGLGGAQPSAGGSPLPSIPLPPLGAVGLSPTLLTASGHQQALNVDKWLLGAALALLALVALSNRRWRRLGHPAWSFIVAPIPGLIALGIVWVSVLRAPATFSGISGLLKLLGGVFIPIYAGSAAVGVAGLVLAGVGGTITNAVGRAGRARRKASSAAPAWGTHGPPRYVPGVPLPDYGTPQDFGKSWPDSDTYAPGGAGAAWGPTAPFPPRGAPSPGPAGAVRPGAPRTPSPRPAPGYPQAPEYRPGGNAGDPYAPPWGPGGRMPPATGNDRGGWPPPVSGGDRAWPPPVPGPADQTWPAPGRTSLRPPGRTPNPQDDAPWPRRDEPPPWPPSGR